MEIVQRRELDEFAGRHDDPCVTIYVQMRKTYPDTKGSRIQFRDFLDEAERLLVEGGLRPPATRDFLAPARELQEDATFWHTSGAEGLAVFIAHDLFRPIPLPYRCPETIDVGRGLYLAPLAHSLLEDAQFLLLTLSPQSVRLYRGDTQGLESLEVPARMPQSEGAVRVNTEFQTSLQYHTSSGFGKTGSLRGTPHGHGDPRDDRHVVFEDFLHIVARELDPLLIKYNLPLFVAAVEEHHPVFRKVCRYPNLQAERILGSPDEMNEQEMYLQAFRFARAWSRRDLIQHQQRYDQQRGSKLASDDIATIAAAAHIGQVNAVFAALGERQWGVFDTGAEEAVAHRERRPGDVDLIDFAVKESLIHRSAVFVTPREDVPDQQPMVATFRW